MRVLLVEDDRDTLATLASVLRYMRYDLLTASNGPLALGLAQAHPPDVVLLDIGLPGMDGYQVAQALRQQAKGRNLYIAAITGRCTASDKKRASDAGIDVHVAKPADPSAVVEVLENFREKLKR